MGVPSLFSTVAGISVIKFPITGVRGLEEINDLDPDLRGQADRPEMEQLQLKVYRGIDVRE